MGRDLTGWGASLNLRPDAQDYTDGVEYNVATAVLETQSPETTVFDTACVKLQRYITRSGNGLVLVRIDGPDGNPLLSLSLFGVSAVGEPRSAPQVEISTYDERSGTPKRADTYPLPSVGDGRARYLIVGESEDAVFRSANDFQKGWGIAYSPLVGSPRLRRDGKWVAEASRWRSSD